jgi:diguanylate cyclase (GGDEF)-like protein
VRRQARTDELTGLANRRRFSEVLERMCAGAQRAPFAVLLVDLDRFKEVNDALGHQTGDALLREVGQRLSLLVRPEDVLARLGGDEFALFVAHVSEDEGRLLAERVRAELRMLFRLGGAHVAIDASVGEALSPQHAAAQASCSRWPTCPCTPRRSSGPACSCTTRPATA